MSTPENTVLVTGSAGYIGAHACKALRRAGYAPVVYDNVVCRGWRIPRSRNASHLVLDAASSRKPNVTIFGNDFETPNGTCIRDYIHVSDLGYAHVKALQALEVEAASAAYRSMFPQSWVNGEQGDPASLVTDASKARDHLGWVPQIQTLDEIIRTALALASPSRAGEVIGIL